MLTLLLFRHAKSAWDDPLLADEKRPLAPRGRKAADLMGRRLAEAGLIPDVALCSPATRARETLALVLPHWAPQPQVTILPDLYRAMNGSYVGIVRAAPAARRLMLVGHNTAMEETAAALVRTGGGDAARARMAATFPTGAVVVTSRLATGARWRRGRGFWRFPRPRLRRPESLPSRGAGLSSARQVCDSYRVRAWRDRDGHHRGTRTFPPLAWAPFETTGAPMPTISDPTPLPADGLGIAEAGMLHARQPKTAILRNGRRP